MNKLFTLAFSLTLCMLFLNAESEAQVARKIIVEHFTNTRCGICGFKNPPFYANLQSQGDALHIAYHPSAPYNNCVLNLHNVAGNDDRTNYYNTYGSTPDFFFQGVFTSGDVSVATVFDPYEAKMSAASIRIVQTNYGTDSINVQTIVETNSTHALDPQRLYIALVEDTVFYNAPNGENEHYDVFRTALTPAEGTSVSLPATVGDSLYYYSTIAANPDWNFGRMYVLAILQDEDTKLVEQAESTTLFRIGMDMDTSNSDTTIANGIILSNVIPTSVYPNPVSGLLYLSNSEAGLQQAIITELRGREMASIEFSGETTIDMALYPSGIYLLHILGEPIRKIIKE
ncbi:MAG: hypothetical protein ACI959_002053 [Limisphaerales bacterium]|jgi:hypothetical protein